MAFFLARPQLIQLNLKQLRQTDIHTFVKLETHGIPQTARAT